VLLFRIVQWLGPIPIGWTLLVLIRGRHWSELLAAGQTATTPPSVKGSQGSSAF